jgi:hypothetical protein
MAVPAKLYNEKLNQRVYNDAAVDGFVNPLKTGLATLNKTVEDLEFVENVEFNDVTKDLKFTFRDNEILTVNIISDSITGISYDATTKELVITVAGQTDPVRIPIGDLVDEYFGSVGDHIQIAVVREPIKIPNPDFDSGEPIDPITNPEYIDGPDSKNVIEGILLNGTIGKPSLTNTLVTEIESKQTAAQVAAYISTHNTDPAAHEDIREEIEDVKKLMEEMWVVEPLTYTPFIVLFTADPDTINSGENVTLAWETENTISVEISNVGAGQDLTGSVVVNPAVTTEYTLTAEGADGSTVTATVIVTVN